MDFLDKHTFENCMRQIISRLDRQEEILTSMQEGRKETQGIANALEEDTMDNQDVCMLLHVSKRTLQRYRSDGLLPYRMHRHKTYYRKADVESFINTHMKEILRDIKQPDGGQKNTVRKKQTRKK